jgi:hypothetical protein
MMPLQAERRVTRDSCIIAQRAREIPVVNWSRYHFTKYYSAEIGRDGPILLKKSEVPVHGKSAELPTTPSIDANPCNKSV